MTDVGRQNMAGIPKYKVVFLGDQGVGKTSLLTQYITNTFDMKIHPTVGVDFIAKNMTVGDRQVKLHLWDTAGQERFHSLIPNYIRDSAIAVIVYDVTNRNSFANVKRWYDEVKQYREHAIIAIVGNKTDLPSDKKEVFPDDLDKLAKEMDVVTMEVSAKTGENIKELFEQLLTRVPITEISQNLSMASPSNVVIQTPGGFTLASDRNNNSAQKNERIVLSADPNKNKPEGTGDKKSKCC